ncbi:MAG TPA: hypothetical protein VGL56_02585 [Fimbriimonadaceae bacterium]|jgi:hypothetical protein
MDQDFRLPEPTEPVTEAEVRALVERFGERQSLGRDQTTVRDVAEALQVESSTVGSMLVELRRSTGQREIQERLDRLEQENAELRVRAQSQVGPTIRSYGDNTVRLALLAGLGFVVVLTIVGGLVGERQWWLGVVPAVFALIGLSRFRRS